MKKLIVILFIAIPFVMTAQMTYVPDDNFEQALIYKGYDSGPLNDSIPTKNIDTVTSLPISWLSISNLIGIEDFRSLVNLDCSGNQLESLNLRYNPALVRLNCNNNKLSSLDVCYNMAIQSLSCSANKLIILDVSNNPSLDSLDCSSNQLTSINVSNNPGLMKFYCSSNHIIYLNLWKNTALSVLICFSNNLNSLDLSKNLSLDRLNTTSNSDLDCIRVIDSLQAANKLNWKKDSFTTYSENCGNSDLPMTYISDDRFEQALIDLGYDSGPLDDLIFTKNIDTITTLDISWKSISDLTGIEDFKSLVYLNCNANMLRRLNLTQNPNLVTLICYYNGLISLNLDKNTALKQLSCDYNQLINLDISNNFLLDSLDCSGNQLISLDCSRNTSLKILNCSANKLKSLHLGNNNTLEVLICLLNKLNSLDLSKNSSLIRLDASMNPDLYCIQVNDSSLAISNPKWIKDPYTVFSEDCSNAELLVTYVPDDNFEKVLILKGYDSFPLNDYVITENIETVKSLDLSRKNICDLTGLKGFKSLESLFCHHNDITVFGDIFNETLKELDCSYNQLKSADLRVFPGLELLKIHNNPLTNLNLSNNLALKYLWCQFDSLISLDINKNTGLLELLCYSNELTSLDIDNNTSMIKLSCDSNNLENLNLSNNPDLKYLSCVRNNLTSLNLSNNTFLKELWCQHNNLVDLDISKNLSLNKIVCSNNNLKVLDVSNNRSLNELECSNNSLKSLDVSNNLGIDMLICYANYLTSLDLSHNPYLHVLDASNNRNLYCIQVYDASEAAQENSWQKDTWAIYSEDCSGVSVDENKIAFDDISISPNPASDYIEINLDRCATSSRCGTSGLRIYNSLGECVMDLTPALSEGEGARIDVSGLPTGVYFININNGKEKLNGSFIVLR